MSEVWPSVPLGEVLKHRKEFIQIDDEQTYKRCRVQLHANGIVLRDAVEGTKIKTKKQQVVKKDEFLVAEIDAKLGGFGIVTADLEGAIVSSHYFLYQINEELIDRRFFGFYIRTPAFREQVGARGSTNYAAIRPHHVLEYITPLPPLSEQRRIVGRLEHLASKIEEARGLHSEAQKYSTSLMETAVNRSFEVLVNTEKKSLASVTSKIGSGSTPKGGKSVYLNEGIPFFRSLNVRMRAFRWKDLAFVDSETHQTMKSTHVQTGDVLLNITGASIGRVACAPPQIETANVNQHVSIIRPLPMLNNRFLMYWLSQPLMQDAINDQQKGATRQALTKRQIEAFEIPLPSISEQLKIVDYLDSFQARIDSLEQLQGQTRGELDALLPSVLDKAFRGEL